ncbi:MAG: hypothetical protein EOO75_05940, partial [Myxococcales bacterium]
MSRAPSHGDPCDRRETDAPADSSPRLLTAVCARTGPNSLDWACVRGASSCSPGTLDRDLRRHLSRRRGSRLFSPRYRRTPPMKTRLNTLTPGSLTLQGRRVLSLSRALPALRAALALAAATAATGTAHAAPVVAVPANSRVENTPRLGNGDGVCSQFAAATAIGSVNNSTLAIALLDQTPGAPAQAAPAGVNNGISSFFGVSYLFDYFDDTGSNGGFTYDLLFPWSKSTGGEICQSHQPATPVVRDAFGARYTGLINIRTAGLKTFAIGSDDGYQLRIGGVTISEFQNNRSTALDTRRATFAEAGVYPFQLIYWEQGGTALLEVSMSDNELKFLGNDRNVPAGLLDILGNDLTGATHGSFPAAYGLRVLGDVKNDQAILFMSAADKAADRCGPAIGKPSDICTLNDIARLCGNAIIDARADGTVESCDDGNETAGDGCSKVCEVEPGFSCSGNPSVCGQDTDKDGLLDSVEITLGTKVDNADSDGDGIGDFAETNGGAKIDTDKDGTIDALDTDSDSDGLLDSAEGTTDLDKDDTGNWRDSDDDGDTILTKDEIDLATKSSSVVDVDKDNSPNYYDVDADGDGKLDSVELTGDGDGDGIPNFLDKNDSSGPDGDKDGDGLTNKQEGDLKTDPD